MGERRDHGAAAEGPRSEVSALVRRRALAGGRVMAVALCAALGIAACGGSASVPTATPSASTGNARLTINVTLTGAIGVTGQLIQPVTTTCAAFAQGRDHMFLIPSGPTNTTLAGMVFQLTAPIAQYAGPGDYSLSTDGFAGNQLATEVTVGPVSAPETFKVEAGGSAPEEAATVNADGSGSFTFLYWWDEDIGLFAKQPFETGTVTWTCASLSN